MPSCACMHNLISTLWLFLQVHRVLCCLSFARGINRIQSTRVSSEASKENKHSRLCFCSLDAVGASWRVVVIFRTGRQTQILPQRSWVLCLAPEYYIYGFFFFLLSPCFPPLQPSLLITECVNLTLTTKGGTTLAFTAHASQTTRPICSAATTTTPPSSTAATRLSSSWSCRSTSPPPLMVMHTSE